MQSHNTRRETLFFTVFIGLFILLILANSLFHEYDHDEFEHVHSAWYLSQGDMPYRDFFQHHHPLLWLLILVFIKIFGPSASLLVLLRLFMFLMLLGIGYQVFRLSSLLTGQFRQRLFSLFLLFSTIIFVEKAIEIRPDVPQVLFALASIYHFMLFCKNQSGKQLLLWTFYLTVSILFLQKSVILLPIYLFLLCWGWLQKKVSTGWVVLSTGGLALPLLLPLILALIFGILKIYLQTNWLLNAGLLNPFSPFRNLLNSAAQNPIFWILALAGSSAILRRKKEDFPLWMVTVTAVLSLLSVFLFPRPHHQYFMLPVTLFCLPAAWSLENWLVGRKGKSLTRVLAPLVIGIIPFVILTCRPFKSSTPQLKRIQYVLDSTSSWDFVYDGDARFNLFRRDLHYFWYGVRPGKMMDAYSRMKNTDVPTYDIKAEILDKKAKIISDFCLDMEDGDLTEWYKPSPFPELYLRVREKERK